MIEKVPAPSLVKPAISRSGSIKSDPVDGRLGARALVPRWVLTGPVSPTRCLGFTDITVGSVFARALTL